MVFFPGGFPGRFPRQSPGGPPSRFPWLPGFPGQPGGGPNFPGGASNVPPPPQHMINQFQFLNQNPEQAQSFLQQQGGVTTFAAGCEGRWTIIFLRNGQVFLMYVLSTNVYGSTTGIIWPNFTFGSFPSSAIAAYSCF